MFHDVRSSQEFSLGASIILAFLVGYVVLITQFSCIGRPCCILLTWEQRESGRGCCNLGVYWQFIIHLLAISTRICNKVQQRWRVRKVWLSTENCNRAKRRLSRLYKQRYVFLWEWKKKHCVRQVSCHRPPETQHS